MIRNPHSMNESELRTWTSHPQVHYDLQEYCTLLLMYRKAMREGRTEKMNILMDCMAQLRRHLPPECKWEGI